MLFRSQGSLRGATYPSGLQASGRRNDRGGKPQKGFEAAVTLIGEVGPKGFTIREVARRARVSHNAPYRHFRGNGELLQAVAIEGFERLTDSMKNRSAAGETAAERLWLCGCGYVDFALRWPHHFLVMFDLPSKIGRAHV